MAVSHRGIDQTVVGGEDNASPTTKLDGEPFHGRVDFQNGGPGRMMANAVVMGFPESGPFEADAVRVRTQLELSGPDIYATGRVERGAYTIRGDIRQGNSGGPMFTPEGQVAGMIFGTDVDVADTGYALTGTQLREVIGDVERLTDPVYTQTCAV